MWHLFKSEISEHTLRIEFMGIKYEIAPLWMRENTKSTLVQVMAWCRQATSHYLSQCWPIYMSPFDVPRPKWVKPLKRSRGPFHGLFDVGAPKSSPPNKIHIFQCIGEFERVLWKVYTKYLTNTLQDLIFHTTAIILELLYINLMPSF